MLYVTTPVLVLIAIIVNLREDDGVPEGDDVEIPAPWRYLLALVGAAASVTGLVMFIAPSLFIDASCRTANLGQRAEVDS